jgi:two-component system, NtrC family, nitrogen regulation response regulator NtrX
VKDNILVVDDDIVLGKILSDILSDAGYDVVHVTNGKDAIEKIKENKTSLMLLDLKLPGMDGMEIFRQTLKIAPEIMVIIMSGHGTIAKAVEATKLGAYDFIEKPLEKERVLLTVRNALEKRRLVRSQSRHLNDIKKKYQMVAVSPAMQNIFSIIDRIATSDSTILITGETGSGKELVARAIHLNSDRKEESLVQVNCAALPEELVESELFGHIKGSFTGAIKDKTGKFQQAHTGTLFLDEIADLSLRAQAKVLRAIEHGEVARVGGNKHEVVTVRIIVATNQDLQQLVEKKLFREDLYHRLNVIPIFVPPLRERQEDIHSLIDHFMGIFCKTNKRKPKTFMPDAMVVLFSYPWKGNVRELRHFVEKMMLLVDDEVVSGSLVSHLLNVDPINFESIDNKTLQKARNNFEKSYILNSLQSNNWKITQTAEELGIARTHLYRKMEKLGIQVPNASSGK